MSELAKVWVGSVFDSLSLPIVGLPALLEALANVANRSAIDRAEEFVNRGGGGSQKIAVARFLGQLKAVREDASAVSEAEVSLLKLVGEVGTPWVYAALVLGVSGNTSVKRIVHIVNPNHVKWVNPVDDTVTVDMSGISGLKLVGVNF